MRVEGYSHGYRVFGGSIAVVQAVLRSVLTWILDKYDRLISVCYRAVNWLEGGGEYREM